MKTSSIPLFSGLRVRFIGELLNMAFPFAVVRADGSSPLVLESVEAIPLFPRVKQGQPLQERIFLHLDNAADL